MTKENKFWLDATQNRSVMKGINHEYFIDNGCKVEIYDDGSIEIYDTMTGGMFYNKKKLDKEYFINIGFNQASLEHAISSCKLLSQIGDDTQKKNQYTIMAMLYEQKLDKYTNHVSKN
jgi:hypothetical protein